MLKLRAAERINKIRKLRVFGVFGILGFLDGKFIYHFHGYEGQACQKDIEPFMQDLEEVYGIHVTKQTEIWSNPDKNSTMKYQAINTNKNRR